MTGMLPSSWRSLNTLPNELCLNQTLNSGQPFRWKKIVEEWCCVIRGYFQYTDIQKGRALSYIWMLETTSSCKRTSANFISDGIKMKLGPRLLIVFVCSV
ncbi:hypothetical protein BJ742DRAFT_468983 [Cladochytrium replicatum]|nr:hypothetical protein BJ742DRAFT_468983 [Cladochytrium replicatum]